MGIKRPLEGNHAELLLEAAAQEQIRLVVPELVLDEAVNNWQEKITELDAARAAAADELITYGAVDRRRRHRPIDADAAAEMHRERLRDRLATAGADFPPLPATDHAAVVRRALARRQPFDEKGHDGYRDVLVWETLLTYAERGFDVVLVSSDVRAFHQSKATRRLSDALADEVFERCGRRDAVRLVNDLRAFTEEILGSSKDAINAALSLFDDQNFNSAFWERTDSAVINMPVPVGRVDLPTPARVLRCSVGEVLDEGDLTISFARYGDDARLLVDLEVDLDVVLRVWFAAAEYDTFAATVGGALSEDLEDDDTAVATVYGWITVSVEAVLDNERRSIRRLRAASIQEVHDLSV